MIVIADKIITIIIRIIGIILETYIHLRLRVLRYQRRKTIITIGHHYIVLSSRLTRLTPFKRAWSTSHPPSTGAVVRTRTAVPGIEQEDKKEDSLGYDEKDDKDDFVGHDEGSNVT